MSNSSKASKAEIKSTSEVLQFCISIVILCVTCIVLALMDRKKNRA